MKTVKLNAFDNPFVYGVDNKEYLVFNIDNETQTLKFQSLIGDLKVKTANILFKANSLPAKLYEMVVDDDILTFTLPSVLTGYNGSMYVYLLLNYSDDLSTSDLYTFKLVDKGSSTFNFEISSICESNISTIVSEEIKNEGIAKSILDTVSNYEFDKLQHAQQSLSLVENAFSSTLEKRIDLFNSAYDKANATKSNTTGDINDSDIDIPSSNTDSDLKDYVENVKTQMSERLKDVTVVSQQIQDEMTQEKQRFLGSSLIFQQDLKQERDIISAYGESTRQHMDQEFNEVKDHADKVFADFSKEIPDLDASIKQVNDKIVATDNKVGTLNTKVTNVENDITELEKMHNEVTQTINNGKLISLYSNSLDFGDYDYSGNPNLFSKPFVASNIGGAANGSFVTQVEDSVRLEKTSAILDLGITYDIFIGNLLNSTQYTLSYDVLLEHGATGTLSDCNIALEGEYGDEHEYIGVFQLHNITTTDVYQKVTSTFMSSANMEKYEKFKFRVYVANGVSLALKIKNVKLERGSTSTPYQPNLLDAPYYLSKMALGKNIANPAKIFPIKSSEYLIYAGDTEEEIVIGQTYTITLKGTKPASQTFALYNYGIFRLGELKPVEGLTDVWSLTFTPEFLQPNFHRDLRIYQYPESTVGPCQIDWLKIEKGETFTPNIERFEYKGISSIETSPNNYYWSAEPFNRSIYSNSVDFGNWDYTGNPNLSAKLNASSFSSGTGATVADDGDEIVFTLDGTNQLGKYSTRTQTPLVEGKQYTISCEIMLEDGFTGDPSGIRLEHAYLPGGASVLQTDTIPKNELNTWQTLTGTKTVKYTSDVPIIWYPLFRDIRNLKPTGKVRLRNIKIEEGSTATPYQPNLLVSPYYLSKVALGENIADPKKVFPVSSTGSEIYRGTMTEPFIVGQTYTVTLEGTKPEHKNFTLSNPGVASYGNFLPVEGLVNVWSLTFTVGGVSSNPNIAAINQVPTENPGSCQINWVKIEKSSVATPNIKEYKYKGFSVKPSNNPNDYEWSIDRQYGEKRLDKMVNTTDPQSIDGTKNFLETPLVKGKEVLYGDRLFEGFYGSGTVHSNFKTKTRLGVGGLVMDDQPRLPEPFEWNSGRWQATVIRDVTFYCEGTMYIDTGANMGKYIYIANWKDEAQTQYASGNPAGMGIAADNGYWYRNLKNFSWIVTLKKGDKFSIGIELATDKEVWNIQIRTLHIKELIPPLE